jgi:elongation factor Ts
MTGVGMMDCKKALTATNGDMEAAVKYLREKGLSKAAAKAERATKEGRIYAYIHSNSKIGVLVEVNCETDFVARTDDFANLCKDIAMHIAASSPLAVQAEDIDPKIVAEEREIYRNKAINEGKPEQIIEKIVEGQVKSSTRTTACSNRNS